MTTEKLVAGPLRGLMEWLERESEEQMKSVIARRGMRDSFQDATAAELRASQGIAEQMEGRKLPKTTVKQARASAQMQDRIAAKIEAEAIQLSKWADLLRALASLPSSPPREVNIMRCPQCAVADQLQCVLDKGHEGDCRYAEWPYCQAAASPVQGVQAQVCEKPMHMYVWSFPPDFFAVAQAATMADAREALLEEIGSSGDGSCPEREAAAEWVRTHTANIWHKTNAEFCLTDSAELRESELLVERLQKQLAERTAAAGQRAEGADAEGAYGLRERMQTLMERLRRYSCPSATASDEFVNGWDKATDHCAERIESILRNCAPPVAEKTELDQAAGMHPNRKGVITHEQARASLRRFINLHFHNVGEKSRASIPAHQDDDDILLSDYISQQSAALGSGQELRERIERVISAGDDLRYDEYGVMEMPIGHLATKWDIAKVELEAALALPLAPKVPAEVATVSAILAQRCREVAAKIISEDLTLYRATEEIMTLLAVELRAERDGGK